MLGSTREKDETAEGIVKMIRDWYHGNFPGDEDELNMDVVRCMPGQVRFGMELPSREQFSVRVSVAHIYTMLTDKGYEILHGDMPVKNCEQFSDKLINSKGDFFYIKF